MLQELDEKVPVNERQNIDRKIKELRDAMSSEDTELIMRQAEELQNAFHALTRQLNAQGGYNGQGSNGHARESSSDDGGEGEVVEGEFRDA
jgi:hypothetical protein